MITCKQNKVFLYKKDAATNLQQHVNNYSVITET